MDTTKSPTHIPLPNMPLRAAKVQSQVKPCKSSSFGSPKRRHHGTTARIHGENGSKKTSPLHHHWGSTLFMTERLLWARWDARRKREVTPLEVEQLPPEDIHPGKLTWNPKMEVWKMSFLFKQVIFRFYVSFRGCTHHTERKESSSSHHFSGAMLHFGIVWDEDKELRFFFRNNGGLMIDISIKHDRFFGCCRAVVAPSFLKPTCWGVDPR